MKAILFPLVMALSAVGGVMAGDFVHTRSAGGEAHAADAHASDKGGHAKKADKAHGGDKGHGSSKGDDKKDGGGETEFLRFKRQFVVPVVEDRDVRSLVLLNIALEVSADKREDMFRMEPRFRDAFIRELLTLSDTGYFDGSLTSPDTYEAMRETLLRAAHNVDKDGVVDVLILDLSRQDS
ncbi:MAG: flagellar basal body-associated FliL family protein [Litorimonas sp.]